ncbi:MAG: DUF3160 domain-containing protein [Planctomycetaceae bacterium]|nr:DUF3160 domain-containing protein [Planctomycetaceae bacterium]
MRATVILSVILAAAGVSLAGDKPPYDLSKVQGMDQFEGSDQAKKLLAAQGFVVTDRQFAKIYTAYTEARWDEPIQHFITTDSAWDTYRALLQEGVVLIEKRQAARLKEFSSKLLAALKARPDCRPLADYAATGLALQAPQALAEDDLSGLLARQLTSGPSQSVQVPIGFVQMPSRFVPISFYAGDPELEGYFRARQWYAGVIFRLQKPRETQLALKLSRVIDADAQLKTLWEQLTRPFDVMLAKTRDGDVAAYAATARGKNIDRDLERISDALTKTLPDPLINDQCLTPTELSHFAALTKGFRLLPPRPEPSGICFQNTVHPKIGNRAFPSGLDFLVACKAFNSPAARAALEKAEGPAVAKAVAAASCGETPDSLYGQSLKLLAELSKPVPASAPPALQAPAWQDKQVWTQLGAWAGQRHTWALHAEQTLGALGGEPLSPLGIVSPYPAFFAGLAQLCRSTQQTLESTLLPPARENAAALLEHLDAFRRVVALESRPDCSDRELKILEGLQSKRWIVYRFLKTYARSLQKSLAEEGLQNSLLQTAENAAKRCLQGDQPTAEEAAVLKMFATTGENDVIARMAELGALCEGLAEIANKQLAGKDLTEAQVATIRNYGETLSRVYSSSYSTDQDDYPVAVPVFVDPTLNTRLCSALAYPQALYVVVPGRGGLVLHRGAVLSYREFRQNIDDKATDAAWQQRIAQHDVPPPPPLTQSFMPQLTLAEAIATIRAGKTCLAESYIPDEQLTAVMIEAFKGGKHKDNEWLAHRIVARSKEEDLVPMLLAGPQVLAACVASRLREGDWSSKRDVLAAAVMSVDKSLAEEAFGLFVAAPQRIPVAQFASALKTQPLWNKRLLCILLGKVKDQQETAAAAMATAAGDQDAGLRWQACAALGELKVRSALVVKVLIERVDDTNVFVAATAVRALQELDANEAAPAILKRLQRQPGLKEVGDEELGKQLDAIGKPGGKEEGPSWIFQSLLGQTSKYGIHRDFVQAIGKFKYAPAKATLLEMLGNAEIQDKAAAALDAIAPEALGDRLHQLVDSKDEVLATNATSLLRSRPKLIQIRRFIALKDKPPLTRGLYCKILSSVVEERAAALEALFAAAGDAEPNIRIEAAEGLVRLDKTDPRVVKALAALAGDKNEQVALTAIGLFGMLHDAGAGRLLLGFVQNGDMAPVTRLHAALVVAALCPDDPQVPKAIAGLLKDPKVEVVEGALILLSNMKATGEAAAIGECIRRSDLDDSSRLKVAQSAADIGIHDPQVIQVVAAMLKNRDDRNTMTVILVLTELKAGEALLACLPKADYSRDAEDAPTASFVPALIEGLGKIKYKPAKARLIEFMEKGHHGAAQALWEICPQEMPGILLERAANSPKRHVRVRALEELGCRASRSELQALVPILFDTQEIGKDEDVIVDGEVVYFKRRACDCAALAIAKILGWRDRDASDASVSSEDLLKWVDRARAWAKEQKTAASKPAAAITKP